MMWNYFDDALDRLRGWPRLGVGPGAADPVVLAAVFPGLRCVWLRRGGKLRQAISWWRAAATGQYALAGGERPAPAPPFDRDAIARLLRYAEECEAGWRDWFSAHAIVPVEIGYEDMTGDLAMTVRELAAFPGVALPPDLAPVRPRLRRQAGQHTGRLVDLFTARAEHHRPGAAGRR